jgi:hypothetical protein
LKKRTKLPKITHFRRRKCSYWKKMLVYKPNWMLLK